MDDITESDGPRVLLRSTPRDENAPTAKSPLMFDLDTTDCLSRHLCLRRDIWPLPVLAPLHSEYEKIRENTRDQGHVLAPHSALDVASCCCLLSLTRRRGRSPALCTVAARSTIWMVGADPPHLDASV